MASCSGNGSNGHHKFTLEVTETGTPSVANNTSQVAFTFKLAPIQTGWNWSYSSTVPVTYNVTINGTEYTGNIMSYDGSSTVTVKSGTQTITHNADGSKSINFSFSVSSISASYLPGSASGSGSITLTKINRTSVYKKIDGAWKHGIIWKKIDGTWRRGLLWKKVDGTWKQGK